MEITDLRKISPRQIEPLLAEEQSFWLDELHWDYRPSSQLVRKFIEGHSLNGYAAVHSGEVLGYGFYVMEERKALIGGLFASAKADQPACGAAILHEIVNSLQQEERAARIETQLMCFGDSLDPLLCSRGFQIFKRHFMLLPLKETAEGGAPIPDGLRIERWDDRYFEATAQLIQTAYFGHIDSAINDQYQSMAGAMKFLKNIVILPGCGEFQPYASFVVKGENARASDPLLAAILTSTVSMGVGHTTQVCIVPELRARRLGLRLMEASIAALRARRYHALSLTVTAQNTRAVHLYERMGFHIVRTFSAAVWQPGPPAVAGEEGAA